MGALIAVVNKRGDSVFNTAAVMLETLGHRGCNALGIASSQRVTIKKTLEELRKEHVESTSLIGHSFAKFQLRDRAQPIQSRDFALVFEGRLFPAPSENEAEFLVEKLARVRDRATCLVRDFDGDYSFAIIDDNGVVVGRDAVGVYPLYFGESEEICAVASERKALWKIGLTNSASFPPGKTAVMSIDGFRFETIRTLTQPPLQGFNMENASQRLQEVLLQATDERVSDVEEVAVAFSGGLDSSIIALLTKICSVKPHLICVELGEQRETVFTEQAAKALDLPLHTATYTLEDVEETLPMVLWLVEEPNPVNISIALPMFWTAQQASKLGYCVLMAGQGGDELFGGYQRYLEDYKRHGLDGLQERLYRDVVSSHETNFQRDNKACAFHKVELRLPFADWNVIQLAISIPPGLKIASPEDMLRKRVLRRMANKLGIPNFIAEKTKKAIQYTTGVNQALKKLAKKEGLTLRKYVEKAFLKAYKTLE